MLELIVGTYVLVNLFAPVSEPDKIEAAINDLIWGDEFAINKDEIHGTSYGILQYRLSTLYHFADRYGIERADPLDPEFQKAVAREMIKDKRAHEHWACWDIMKLSYE